MWALFKKCHTGIKGTKTVTEKEEREGGGRKGGREGEKKAGKRQKTNVFFLQISFYKNMGPLQSMACSHAVQEIIHHHIRYHSRNWHVFGDWDCIIHKRKEKEKGEKGAERRGIRENDFWLKQTILIIWTSVDPPKLRLKSIHIKIIFLCPSLSFFFYLFIFAFYSLLCFSSFYSVLLLCKEMVDDDYSYQCESKNPTFWIIFCVIKVSNSHFIIILLLYAN